MGVMGVILIILGLLGWFNDGKDNRMVFLIGVGLLILSNILD